MHAVVLQARAAEQSRRAGVEWTGHGRILMHFISAAASRAEEQRPAGATCICSLLARAYCRPCLRMHARTTYYCA